MFAHNKLTRGSHSAIYSGNFRSSSHNFKAGVKFNIALSDIQLQHYFASFDFLQQQLILGTWDMKREGIDIIKLNFYYASLSIFFVFTVPPLSRICKISKKSLSFVLAGCTWYFIRIGMSAKLFILFWTLTNHSWYQKINLKYYVMLYTPPPTPPPLFNVLSV